MIILSVFAAPKIWTTFAYWHSTKDIIGTYANSQHPERRIVMVIQKGNTFKFHSGICPNDMYLGIWAYTPETQTIYFDGDNFHTTASITKENGTTSLQLTREIDLGCHEVKDLILTE